MSSYKEVLNEVGSREDEIAKLCCDLIGFKSENPLGDVTYIAGFVRNKLEIPTVCFGPVSETAHSANEYVMKKDLTLCSKAYALIAIEFLS